MNKTERRLLNIGWLICVAVINAAIWVFLIKTLIIPYLLGAVWMFGSIVIKGDLVWW